MSRPAPHRHLDRARVKRAVSLIMFSVAWAGICVAFVLFAFAGVTWLLMIGRDSTAAADFIHSVFVDGGYYVLWFLGAVTIVLQDLQHRQPATADMPRIRASRRAVGARETNWRGERFEVVEVCRHGTLAEYAEGCAPLRKKWRRIAGTVPASTLTTSAK